MSEDKCHESQQCEQSSSVAPDDAVKRGSRLGFWETVIAGIAGALLLYGINPFWVTYRFHDDRINAALQRDFIPALAPFKVLEVENDRYDTDVRVRYQAGGAERNVVFTGVYPFSSVSLIIGDDTDRRLGGFHLGVGDNGKVDYRATAITDGGGYAELDAQYYQLMSIAKKLKASMAAHEELALKWDNQKAGQKAR